MILAAALSLLAAAMVVPIFYLITVMSKTCDEVGDTSSAKVRNGDEEGKMKLWDKRKKLTATDDLVDFIILKLFEDPDKWVSGKTTSFLNYKGSNVWVGFKTEIGNIYRKNIKIALSAKQTVKIKDAVRNLFAAQALRNIMKVAVKNTV